LKHKGVKQVARKTRTVSGQLHVPAAIPLGEKSHDGCRTGGWLGPETNLNTSEKERTVTPNYEGDSNENLKKCNKNSKHSSFVL
jgi:hypothetical protein